MHDAGEKDTPPSDRLVVARKPLLPAPYARFYSSTRFRSVSRFRARLLSSPSKLFELSAILVAPPLPAARSRPYRSSPIETCSKTRAHYSSILESSNLCFDRSLLVLSRSWGEVSIMITSGGEISPDTFLSFSKDFDWFGIWDCWVTTQYSERRVCASRRILPWISKELLERRFNACGQYGTKLKIGNWMWSEAKLGSWRRDTSVRVRWERSSRSNVSKYNYETCKRSIRFKDDN